MDSYWDKNDENWVKEASMVIGSLDDLKICFLSGDSPGLRFISLEFLADRGMQSLNVCLCLQDDFVVWILGDEILVIASLDLDFDWDEAWVEISLV